MAEETTQNVPVEVPAPVAAPAVEAPKAETSRTAPPLPEGVQYIWGTGRRKSAVARVRIRPGTGKILINTRELDQYFTQVKDRVAVTAALQVAHMMKAYDVFVRVSGGGPTGQAGAVELGLARAMIRAVPDAEGALRDAGLLTRDARMKERKKYGQRGARRRFQFSKR